MEKDANPAKDGAPPPAPPEEEPFPGYFDLPEQFSIRGENGQYSHIREPVYNLLAPGFYGRGNAGTFYDEGETLVYDGVPNYHLQPLNRAAGNRVASWLRALPASGASINIDDLAEAAAMISGRPELAKMSKEQISAATQKIAVELKKKRDATSGMTLPPMQGQTIYTAGQSQTKPPAMPATRFLDPSIQGPGYANSRGVIHEPTVDTAGSRRAGAPQFASTTR